MERRAWIQTAYRYLEKAGAAAPRAVVALCRVCAVLLVADLIWFGVMNDGVRSAAPGIVRAEALARFEEGMSQADITLVEASYSAPNTSGVRYFSGDPAQLHPLSRLSRAFSCAAAGESVNVRAGTVRVQDEYEAQGLPRTFLRLPYLMQGAHDLASCVALLLCAKHGRAIMSYLYQFVSSRLPSD